jgi:DNA-binding protein
VVAALELVQEEECPVVEVVIQCLVHLQQPVEVVALLGTEAITCRAVQVVEHVKVILPQALEILHQ